jgi:hypothetical protein
MLWYGLSSCFPLLRVVRRGIFFDRDLKRDLCCCRVRIRHHVFTVFLFEHVSFACLLVLCCLICVYGDEFLSGFPFRVVVVDGPVMTSVLATACW